MQLTACYNENRLLGNMAHMTTVQFLLTFYREDSGHLSCTFQTSCSCKNQLIFFLPQHAKIIKVVISMMEFLCIRY